MPVFTKLGEQIASPVNGAGSPRGPSPQEFQVWMTETERALESVDGIPSDISAIQASLTSLQSTVSPLPAALNAVEIDVAALESQIGGIEVSGDTITKATWAQLLAQPGTRNGQRGYVESDGGTHTDPVVGGTVQNAGIYTWSTAPAGWRWLRGNDLGVRPNLTTENLDAIVLPGLYGQPLTGNATLARNYPEAAAGVLEVIVTGAAVIVQRYTSLNGFSYWRTKYSTFAWYPWNTVKNDKQVALGSEDLDTLKITGTYFQVIDGGATVALHYPAPESGILEVINFTNFTVQRYTSWYGRSFWRVQRAAFAWQGWYEVARLTAINQPYAGKKIAWIGDSIVEGNGYPTTIGQNLGASVSKFGFASATMSKHPQTNGFDKLAMYRLATAIATGNFANVIAGAEWLRDNSTPVDDNTPQANAMAALDWATVDYLVIAFGTNDCYGTTPLGTTLTPDATGSTFMGALAYVIETIQAARPGIQIMFLGMSWRTRFFNVTPEQNSDTVPDAEGKYLYDYQDAIIAAGDKYRIPAYDFYRTSGINRATYAQYLSDGVHPNANGVALWVKKMAAFLLAN